MSISDIIQALMGLVIAMIGWYANRVQSQVDKVQAAQVALELKVAEKTISKEDFRLFETRLFEKLEEFDKRMRSIP
jgi:hypothetical protein